MVRGEDRLDLRPSTSAADGGWLDHGDRERGHSKAGKITCAAPMITDTRAPRSLRGGMLLGDPGRYRRGGRLAPPRHTTETPQPHLADEPDAHNKSASSPHWPKPQSIPSPSRSTAMAIPARSRRSTLSGGSSRPGKVGRCRRSPGSGTSFPPALWLFSICVRLA